MLNLFFPFLCGHEHEMFAAKPANVTLLSPLHVHVQRYEIYRSMLNTRACEPATLSSHKYNKVVVYRKKDTDASYHI
jgi:hypothetical protein